MGYAAPNKEVAISEMFGGVVFACRNKDMGMRPIRNPYAQ